MKNWLKRGKTGNDSSRDDISLPLSSRKIHSEEDSSYNRMSTNETQSIISDQVPPSHQPPSQIAGSYFSGNESTSTKSRVHHGSVPTNMDRMEAHSETKDDESKVKIPEMQLELVKSFFAEIPVCDSLIQRKILISSEHYFRVALESYEHLRAVHYRASQNFTLAEWLHIHALLLYGRIQQVQLNLESKGNITQHNKIDLSGDIKVFSPIATILAAIGGVEDHDNGVLYIPDAFFPERPSSDAAYSAAEMQQILNGTLYDWQRSWGRVLEARFERDSRDDKYKMTRSASDLMAAIRDTANSIESIRQRQQVIEEENEETEDYIIKLATKERNLSQLFDEARNAKDYTLRPPCDRVYSFKNPAFSASDPTLDAKPKRTSTLMNKDAQDFSMYQNNASVPEIASPTQTSQRTTDKATMVPASFPTARSPPAPIPTRPNNFNKKSSVVAGSPTIAHNALVFQVNHQPNKQRPISKAVIMDEDIIPLRQSRRNRRGFHTGSPELHQNQIFSELNPTYSLDPKKNSPALAKPRRFSSLRNQFTQVDPLVPNVDTSAYRPGKMSVFTGPIDPNTGEGPSIDASKVSEHTRSREDPHSAQQIVAPLSPPISAHNSKKAVSGSAESPTEATSYFNNYVNESFSNSEVSLLTPPDTSFDSEVGSLIDTPEKSLSDDKVDNNDNFEHSDSTGRRSVRASSPLGSGSVSVSGSGSEVETGLMSDYDNDNEEIKSFMTADDSRIDQVEESINDTTQVDQDYSGAETSNPRRKTDQETDRDAVEIMTNSEYPMSSPLLSNRRFTPEIPERSAEHTTSLGRVLSTSKKSARKVTIGGSSDNLDQFVHYDAQLWSDYTTFVNSISDSKLATFEPVPTKYKGDMSWALPVKVNHKSPQREITVKLPHKKVSKQEQVLALILQTCYEHQNPVQYWHNEVRVDVNLHELVSKYVASAVDDRTL